MKPVNIGILITAVLSIFLFQGWGLVTALATLLIIWVMAFITWAFDNAEEVDDFVYRARTEA